MIFAFFNHQFQIYCNVLNINLSTYRLIKESKDE